MMSGEETPELHLAAVSSDDELAVLRDLYVKLTGKTPTQEELEEAQAILDGDDAGTE